ncbi:formylglycine-generating enzyme family protein [Sorangium sp. So ce233]|uniref:formylglycine-generating enzyme family protein n=1 Tax=Sorangium sp. So ce233 TaxID=3133290 RepID=UPI003F60E990
MMRSERPWRGAWVGIIAAVLLGGGCVDARGAGAEQGAPGEGEAGGAAGSAAAGDDAAGGSAGGLAGSGGAASDAAAGGGAAGGAAGGDAIGGGGAGDGGGGSEGPASAPSCGAGAPSMGLLCGPERTSCCDSKPVPGGTFKRYFDGVNRTDDSYPATVSGFLLDTYEVTVGRFRAFVEAGGGTQASAPETGAGAHPRIPGSGWPPLQGWDQDIAHSTARLKAALRCDPALATWTDEVGPNEALPINCITWLEAFAFCLWDGGRLPTSTELSYAAAGGDEQREYPWGQGIDLSRSGHDCLEDGSLAGQCALSDLLPVGSKPMGRGRWGHQDLGGSVQELVRDWLGDAPTPCIDCAVVDEPITGYMDLRGGSFLQEARAQLVVAGDFYRLPSRLPGVGVRCARTLPAPE